MDVAVGVGRPVVQHEFRPPGGLAAQAPVEVDLLPARQDLGLLLRQPGAHGKIGLGQKQSLAVIADGIGHGGLNLEREDGG